MQWNVLLERTLFSCLVPFYRDRTLGFFYYTLDTVLQMEVENAFIHVTDILYTIYEYDATILLCIYKIIYVLYYVDTFCMENIMV